MEVAPLHTLHGEDTRMESILFIHDWTTTMNVYFSDIASSLVSSDLALAAALSLCCSCRVLALAAASCSAAASHTFMASAPLLWIGFLVTNWAC